MRLTDVTIRALPLAPTGSKKYWDERTPGFGVRCTAKSKSFIVMFGKTRRLQTLGKYPDISLREARQEAKRILALKPEKNRLETTTAAVRAYLEDAETRLRPNTLREYTRHLLKAPDKPLEAMTKKDINLDDPQAIVKRQKNDAADAEAIVIAAQRPEMRFVEAKSDEQIARGVVFRARDRLVRQRTEQINALRSVLYEQGWVFSKGIHQMKKIAEFLQQADNGLLSLVREECDELLASISDLTTRIQAKTLKLKKLSQQSEISRRLQTIPGVGPLTAMAVESFAPSMDIFRCGRDFAAWLGLVPKQHSSGGKERLGKVSKAGQVDIRRLLIIGAMTRIAWAGRKPCEDGSWLDRMLKRKPKMLVAIALANKMARTIWAVLTKEEDYRDPAKTVAA